MFSAERYRAKANEYSKLARAEDGPKQLRDCERLERISAEPGVDAQRGTEASDRMMRAKDHAAGPSRPVAKSTMPRRPNGFRKPEVILAGVFADRLLSTVDPRFTARIVGDELVDFDKVDFANVSLVVIFGYGHRIAEQHLNKAPFINLHGSLLPLGQGPHPHIWSWINGEPNGVTIHKMSAEIDKGPVIVQRKVDLEPWESSINSTMYALVDAATELFQENWNDLAAGSFALKTADQPSGSSHRLKDLQQIRDIVYRFADAPIPIFLQEASARMAVSSLRQAGLYPSRAGHDFQPLPASGTDGLPLKRALSS